MITPPIQQFPDFLNPILVKELRQGLRGRVFVICLLLLQVAMVFLSFFGLAAAGSGESTEDFAVVFWIIAGIPLLLVLPAAGLGAVSGEHTAKTLELLFMSRLTARRILLGKWLALVVQAVLLVCAIFPYAVLRYFLGSVSIGQELSYLGGMLLACTVLTGVAVGFSPLPAWLTRLGALLFLFFGFWGSSVFLVYARFTGGLSLAPKGGYAPWAMWCGLFLVGAALLVLLLEFGAGLIAPPVENHSTPIRLLVLGSMGLAALFAHVAPAFAIPALASVAVLARVVCIGVLCEMPRMIPRLYRPFVRWGLPGRLLGRVLYPGWPSGVFFNLLVTGGCFLLAYFLLPKAVSGGGEPILVAWVEVGAALFPFAIMRSLWTRVRWPFGGYLVLQLGIYLLFAIEAMVKVAAPQVHVEVLFKLLPLYALASASHGGTVFDLYTSSPGTVVMSDLLGAAFTTLLTLLVLIWRMHAPGLEIAACEREAAQWPRGSAAG